MKIRQLCFASLLLVFVATNLSLCSPMAFAQSSVLPGQQQYYSVYMRGNGEAVVSVKINATQIADDGISTLQLGGLPKDANAVIVYQITSQSPKPCVYPLPPDTTMTPTPMDYNPSVQGRMPLKDDLMIRYPCESYEQTYPYWQGSNKFIKAEIIRNDDTVTIQLPETVSSGGTTHVLLTYRTFSYAKKSFGSYSYTFTTLSSPDGVQSVQIGLSTEPEYALRDDSGHVNYARSMVATTVPPTNIGAETQLAVLDSYYGQIGFGSVQRYADNLSPNESYTIKGTYADAQWKLYGKEIVIGLILTLLILTGFGYGVKRLYRMTTSQKNVTSKSITNTYRILLMSIGFSFILAICAVGLSLLFFVLSKAMNIFFPYYYSWQIVVALLIGIVQCGTYALLLLCPAIYWGMKRGIWWGVSLFGMTIAWLGLASMIALLVSYLLMGRNPMNVYPFHPMPVMEKSNLKDLLPDAGVQLSNPSTSTSTPARSLPPAQE